MDLSMTVIAGMKLANLTVERSSQLSYRGITVEASGSIASYSVVTLPVMVLDRER